MEILDANKHAGKSKGKNNLWKRKRLVTRGEVVAVHPIFIDLDSEMIRRGAGRRRRQFIGERATGL